MISPKQQKILAFPYSSYDAIICDGAVRSGKTSIMCVAFIDWAMRNFSNMRFGICGKTVGSATENIIKPYMAMSYAKDRYTMKWRRSDKMLEVSRGSVKNWFEVFGGKDESSYMLIQGRTLAGVLLDEVALMTESFVQQALARCSVTGAKLWFSCNPDNPGHWFYQEWILKHEERNALYLRFAMTDNPGLSKKTIEDYENRFDGVFYRRYVLGEWVAAEGLVYPMFDYDKHVLDALPPRSGEFYISVDYGTVNPCSMGLWQLYNGHATRIKEYYYNSRAESGYRRTDEEHYAELEKLAAGYNIEVIIIDPSAASMKETIRRHGKFAVWDADNSVLDGIRLMGTLLKAGRISVHKDCEGFISEIQSYVWDEDSTEDAVIKENDHAMDDSRYFFQTIMRREIRDANI